MNDQDEDRTDLTRLTGRIVSAYVANNALSSADLPKMVADVHAALAGLGMSPAVPEQREPAVPIRRSVQLDAITCLECGKKFRTIKRHLMSNHQLTPEQYRERWGLARDYPIVAPAYSEVRSGLAKNAGLGRKPAAKGRRSARR